MAQQRFHLTNAPFKQLKIFAALNNLFRRTNQWMSMGVCVCGHVYACMRECGNELEEGFRGKTAFFLPVRMSCHFIQAAMIIFCFWIKSFNSAFYKFDNFQKGWSFIQSCLQYEQLSFSTVSVQLPLYVNVERNQKQTVQMFSRAYKIMDNNNPMKWSGHHKF